MWIHDAYDGMECGWTREVSFLCAHAHLPAAMACGDWCTQTRALGAKATHVQVAGAPRVLLQHLVRAAAAVAAAAVHGRVTRCSDAAVYPLPYKEQQQLALSDSQQTAWWRLACY